MRSAITASLVPEARSGPFVFSDGLRNAFRRAASLGFDGVEIFPPSATEPELDAVSELIRHHGVDVAAVGTGAGWVVHKLTLTDADPAVRRRAREFVRNIIEAAAQWSAPAIIGSMQGRWDADMRQEDALRHLADALEELAEHAGKHRVSLLYEPLNRYETNLFNRLGDAAAWLRGLDTSNVRLLADLFHMNIEESDSAAALQEAGVLVGHVHFADSNRRAVGMGQTRVAPIIESLRKIRYTGYLSAEIFPLPDPDLAARQTLTAFRKYVTAP